MPIKQPFPVFNTERLLLRELRQEDREALFGIHADPRVNIYLDRPIQRTIAQTDAFISRVKNGVEEGEWFFWTIILKGQNDFIGTICLWDFNKVNRTAAFGYELHPDFQGKGYMNEALSRVIKYGFEVLGLQKIEASTHTHHKASISLLEKNNFLLDPYKSDPENVGNQVFYLYRTR